jgi:hypothetical protein
VKDNKNFTWIKIPSKIDVFIFHNDKKNRNYIRHATQVAAFDRVSPKPFDFETGRRRRAVRMRHCTSDCSDANYAVGLSLALDDVYCKDAPSFLTSNLQSTKQHCFNSHLDLSICGDECNNCLHARVFAIN